jgi:hypothetical protein
MGRVAAHLRYDDGWLDLFLVIVHQRANLDLSSADVVLEEAVGKLRAGW